MVKITAKKGTVKSAGGWEEYLREEYGLLDNVELDTIEDDGMHGSYVFVFDTPDGDIRCSGYISQPPVATYKMSVTSDYDRRTLFGIESYEELKELQEQAENGF